MNPNVEQRQPGIFWSQEVLQAYKKLKGNRDYALGDDAELALAAICRAHQ